MPPPIIRASQKNPHPKRNRWLATASADPPLAGSADHTARLWDLRAKDPAANPVILRGHRSAVWAVAISDVVNLASAAVSYNLRAWTDRYEDWVQMRSDLAVAVDEALTRGNITLA